MDNAKLGKALAAIAAAGIGSATLGLATTMAEFSDKFKSMMNLYDPVGPLAGKTLSAVAIWLIAWAILRLRWGKKAPVTSYVLMVSFTLIGFGFLGTFPMFFQLFTIHH